MSRHEDIRKIYKVCQSHDTFEKMSWYPKIIRLADVLAALRISEGHAFVLIDQDGLFVRMGEGRWEHFVKSPQDTPPIWDIYRDDIEEQNDITVAWIASMI